MRKIIVFLFLIGGCFFFTASAATEESTNYIYVDLKGAIENPGVYRVSSNCRVFQVIKMAGGMTDEANTRYINLAQILDDEMIVYIPSYGEEEEVGGLININIASLALLDGLPDIGITTAQAIIDYRNANGNFKSIEDIKNVSGIGQSTYEKIKDYITV